MPLAAAQKTEIIAKFRLFEGDTGSPEVQIALLTNRIAQLTDHLKEHKHDNHSRLGLLKMVSGRRKLLNFLKKVNFDRYLNIIKELGIRR